MAVVALESRVLLDSSALPSDIVQTIQNSAHPAAFYAALDVMLPAFENFTVATKQAMEARNAGRLSITAYYDTAFDNLVQWHHSSRQAANDTYWGMRRIAENSLTVAFQGAKAIQQNTVSPAFTVYEQAVRVLKDAFDSQQILLQGTGSGASSSSGTGNGTGNGSSSGSGGSGTNSGSSTGSGSGSGSSSASAADTVLTSLWTTLLTGELAAWGSFVAIRRSAAATFTATMDSALTAWTSAVNPAWSARESAFASIEASAVSTGNMLKSALASEVQLVEDQFTKDVADLEQDWQLALLDAKQAWDNAISSPGSYAGFAWTGPQNPFAGVGSGFLDYFRRLGKAIREAPQGAFDTWEGLEWDSWRVTAEVKLADKPVAYLLLEHSLQDSPPDIVFTAGHFVTNAIDQSPELAAKILEIVNKHKSQGPGTYTDDGATGINFNTGDLYLGIHSAKFQYTLTLSANQTYSITSKLVDTYDFALSMDYVKFSFSGVATTVAVNIAWVDQHLQMIENYDWTANLTPKTGTW